VPGDGDGLVFGANVLCHDAGVHSLGSKADGDDEIGFGEPVAAEIPCMNDAGNLLPAGYVFHGDAVGFGFEDEAMHGVALGRGQLSDIIGRQGNRMTLPLGGERLAVRGELAANPVGVGNQEGRTEPIAQIAEVVVVRVEHLFCAGQVWRRQHVHIALAGEVGGDLQNLHSAARRQRDAGEFRLGGTGGSAGERNDFLAANFSHGLGMANENERACQ